MKIKKFCKVTLALAVAVSSMASVVCEASNLDTYRNLLMRKTYTIKYQEITPQHVQLTRTELIFMVKTAWIPVPAICLLISPHKVF